MAARNLKNNDAPLLKKNALIWDISHCRHGTRFRNCDCGPPLKHNSRSGE